MTGERVSRSNISYFGLTTAAIGKSPDFLLTASLWLPYLRSILHMCVEGSCHCQVEMLAHQGAGVKVSECVPYLHIRQHFHSSYVQRV